MLDARIFDDMAEQLGKLLPPGVNEMRQDFEQNARSVIQSTLAKMDLVTREDFDVQVALLQKTSARLNELEERIKVLESISDNT